MDRRVARTGFTLTNVQPTNAGIYFIRVTDAFGSITNQIATLTVNRPPAPGSVSRITGQAIPITVPTSALVNAGSDPDGDPVTVNAVTSPSLNGGLLMLSNGSFLTIHSRLLPVPIPRAISLPTTEAEQQPARFR